MGIHGFTAIVALSVTQLSLSDIHQYTKYIFLFISVCVSVFLVVLILTVTRFNYVRMSLHMYESTGIAIPVCGTSNIKIRPLDT